MRDHRELMTDEYDRQVKTLLQLAKEIQNLSLYRNIQTGDCLVRDEDFRIDRERASNCDALALATR